MKIADETRQDGTGIRIHSQGDRFLIEVSTTRRSGFGLEIASLELCGWDFDLLREAMNEANALYLRHIEDSLVELSSRLR